MNAYGIEIDIVEGVGWGYDCNCGFHLGGTSEDVKNIRNAIYSHREGQRHSRLLTAAQFDRARVAVA